MDFDFEVLGPESSIIYYNLNKQFATIKKLIITKEILFDSFESFDLKSTFERLSHLNREELLSEINQVDTDQLFSVEFNSEFYRTVQDRLSALYSTMAEVKLENYSFMNAVDNTKFSVVLRTSSFSITRHYVEKGALLSAMKQVLREHLLFEGNAFAPNRLMNFQIEIFESFEVYKHIFLKKEGDALVLSSSFGYPRLEPVGYHIGPELYYSKGQSFHFFKNVQSTAVLRDHTKVTELDINKQEKILSNDDLVLINNQTKNINDALVELVITRKGELKILNVSLLDNTLYNGNDKGIIINKSTKQYNRVSLITLRDRLEEDTPNPKYLLIRNQEEIRELFNHFSYIRNLDGLIFTSNFYHPLLDHIGSILDLDIVFYNEMLSKTLDTAIDFNEVVIEGSQQQFAENPFSSILDEQKKEKDELLERLKSLDLNTPTQQPQPQGAPDRNAISSLAQNIISSPSSSQQEVTEQPTSMFGASSSLGERKGAIAMIADSVMNNGNQPQAPSQPAPQPEPQPQQEQSNFATSSLVENISSEELKPVTLDMFDQPAQQPQAPAPSVHHGTKLLTTPQVQSHAYFVDPNTIAQVREGEIFYLVTDAEHMKNPNVNYVVPMQFANEHTQRCHLLINTFNDYFGATDATRDYFVNLTQLEPNQRETFLQESIRRFNSCSVIVFKDDLTLLEKYIKHIPIVFVKDLTSQQELETAKHILKDFDQKADGQPSSMY